jgi:hypothetical protein
MPLSLRVRLLQILYDVIAFGHSVDAVFLIYEHGHASLTAYLFDLVAFGVARRYLDRLVVESDFVELPAHLRTVRTAVEFVQFDRHVFLYARRAYQSYPSL